MSVRMVVAVGLLGISLLPSVSNALQHAGYGSMTASGGVMAYVADEDTRTDAGARFILNATFEFSPRDHWAWRIGSGVGWNTYDRTIKTEGALEFEDPHPVKVVVPTVFSVLRRFGGTETGRHWFAGGGIGLYYWHYSINGAVQQDPVTFEKVRSGNLFGAVDGGLHGLFGYEYPLSQTVGLSGEFLAHYVFSSNDTDRPGVFPDGHEREGESYVAFNGNDAFMEFRIGIKVHFELDRFEREEEIY